MSVSAKKLPAGSNLGRRSSNDPSLSPPARRSPTPSSTSSINGGLARTRSLRGGASMSARGVMQRSNVASSNLSTNTAASEAEDDSRAEAAALVEDLKERLRQADIKAEQFQKHAEVLQSRLDEAIQEQGKLEDRLHEGEEQLEVLQNEKRETSRQRREMESIFEAERLAMTKEKEDMASREEEMQTVIQRLKDSLNQRSNMDDESRASRHSNNSSPSLAESGHFAPSALHRSDSRSNSKLILQKDRLIESLRLELAEAQIRLVESENMGGGRLQEVERLLLEARMTNARLMEDNESYQLLLSEKTLNGDFTKSDFGYVGAGTNADALNALEGRTTASSLADELSEAAEGENENYRRLEAELKSAKDQNKALTLYINKIIERLLQHQDFETILDQSSDFKPPASNVNKELPPPPPPKEAASGASFLQRAKSVAMGGNRMSVTQPKSSVSDPNAAPSIPLGLGRSASVRSSRPKSDQFSSSGTTHVVNQMYRGPSGQMSPPLHGAQIPRNRQSTFAPLVAGGNSNAGSRQPSGSYVQTSGTFPGGRTSDSSSITSDDVTTPLSNSPPRPEKSTTLAGNKPRPLKLVQDHPETMREDKQNKRSSWMGWASSALARKADSDVIKQ